MTSVHKIKVFFFDKKTFKNKFEAQHRYIWVLLEYKIKDLETPSNGSWNILKIPTKLPHVQRYVFPLSQWFLILFNFKFSKFHTIDQTVQMSLKCKIPVIHHFNNIISVSYVPLFLDKDPIKLWNSIGEDYIVKRKSNKCFVTTSLLLWQVTTVFTPNNQI